VELKKREGGERAGEEKKALVGRRRGKRRVGELLMGRVAVREVAGVVREARKRRALRRDGDGIVCGARVCWRRSRGSMRWCGAGMWIVEMREGTLRGVVYRQREVFVSAAGCYAEAGILFVYM
jgi:hypothetical protein